ncbi:MAG: cell division protein ZapA [Bacteroidetes bacterium]|nr:cell division protein ZapA [Bacteroidota bacterium]
MDTLIPISIVIGDRTYRIKIQPKDEEAVRKTVKIINDKILEFKTSFAGKDMQDYIAMVLVWYATDQTAAASAGIEKEFIEDKLSALEKLLDAQLKPQ